MPISTRTVTKAIHRTTLTYTAEFGHRADKGVKFIFEAVEMIQKEQQVGSLIIQFGPGGGVSGITFEETQTVPQRDIQRD